MKRVEPKMFYHVRATDCAAPIYHPTSADNKSVDLNVISRAIHLELTSSLKNRDFIKSLKNLKQQEVNHLLHAQTMQRNPNEQLVGQRKRMGSFTNVS